ncbi:MAG: DUF393 domain-containing protein [Planctomycetota bacterium]
MAETETIFYDGDCGLCHRGVKFVVRCDHDGKRFAFAPLGGETFTQKLSAEQRTALPDSIVVHTADGRLLTRSEATRHILRRLGGVWSVAAAVMGVAPRGLRDWGYRGVASIRHRIFKKPAGACPVLPEDLRKRFLP